MTPLTTDDFASDWRAALGPRLWSSMLRMVMKRLKLVFRLREPRHRPATSVLVHRRPISPKTASGNEAKPQGPNS
jgi:hypothetical protein